MFGIIKINGEHLVLNGISGNALDQDGSRTINVPVVVNDLAQTFTLDPQAVANAIGIGYMQCVSRPIQELEHGEFQITFQFKGLPDADPNSLAGDDFGIPPNAQYGFDSDMSEESIKTHPDWLTIREQFDWIENDDQFAEYYTPKTTDKKNATQKDKKTEKEKNPFYGVESWLKVGGFFTIDYTTKTIPARVYDGIGLLVSYPPHADKLNIPKFSNRVWLKYSPQVNSSGTAFRILERYRLSGIINGSEDIIYNISQLAVPKKISRWPSENR